MGFAAHALDRAIDEASCCQAMATPCCKESQRFPVPMGQLAVDKVPKINSELLEPEHGLDFVNCHGLEVK